VISHALALLLLATPLLADPRADLDAARADALRALEAAPPDPAAFAAAHDRVRAMWDPVYARLKKRPGPDFSAQLALAEQIGRDRAELDLLTAGPGAARATLAELARATSGSPLGLAFERAATDLDWTGRRAPPLEARPVSATTTAATTAVQTEQTTGAVRLVFFFAGWDGASRDALVALHAVCAKHPEVPALAVALDESERLADLAKVIGTSPPSLKLAALPDGWASRTAREYHLSERGVPVLLVLRSDGTVARALESWTFIETWIRRAR
jgi:hypothetical protein